MSDEKQCKQQPDEAFIVELDERLEFGAALLSTGLFFPDSNSGPCTNDAGCYGHDTACVNLSNCPG